MIESITNIKTKMQATALEILTQILYNYYYVVEYMHSVYS